MTTPLTLAARLATALALLAGLAACGGPDQETIVGSGHLVSEDRDVTAPFHGVRIVGAGEVVLTQGPVPAVRVEADDNVLPLVTTEVQDGVLVVGPTGLSLSHATVRLQVTTAAIDLLEIDGAGAIRAGPLAGGAIAARLLGAGQITLSGGADALTVQLAGAGDVRAFDLTAVDATVTLSGAGNVEVTATEALAVTLSGVGQVTYDGHPASVQQVVTGVGQVVAR